MESTNLRSVQASNVKNFTLIMRDAQVAASHTMFMYCAFLCVLRQAVHSVTNQDQIDTTGGNLKSVIARQVPGVPDFFVVIRSA